MNKKILENAIEHYGCSAQLDMCIEEMSELTKAICKLKRNITISEGNSKAVDMKCLTSDIVEEVADVEIMMEQLKMMFQCHTAVNTAIEYKLERLSRRIAEDEEK